MNATAIKTTQRSIVLGFCVWLLGLAPSFAVDTRTFIFRDVNVYREKVDGKNVVVVAGTILNTSNRDQHMPQLVRVAWRDNTNKHEVIHWVFRPVLQKLGSGQEMPFLTRFSNPPAEVGPPGVGHLVLGFPEDSQ